MSDNRFLKALAETFPAMDVGQIEPPKLDQGDLEFIRGNAEFMAFLGDYAEAFHKAGELAGSLRSAGASLEREAERIRLELGGIDQGEFFKAVQNLNAGLDQISNSFQATLAEESKFFMSIAEINADIDRIKELE